MFFFFGTNQNNVNMLRFLQKKMLRYFIHKLFNEKNQLYKLSLLIYPLNNFTIIGFVIPI